MTFKSILYLDDIRKPSIFGITHVRSYDEFVAYLQNNPMPELISFDHDLSLEHYPMENISGMKIPYDTFKEKTGLHCARYIIENNLPLSYWSVHSMNVTGADNIRTELRAYCPGGEVMLKIPYRIP